VFPDGDLFTSQQRAENRELKGAHLTVDGG
jgi:hypothetical protein